MGAAKRPLSRVSEGRGALGVQRSVVGQRSSGRFLLAWQCVASRARGARARRCSLFAGVRLTRRRPVLRRRVSARGLEARSAVRDDPRIFRTTTPSQIIAISLRRAPQCGHSSTSMAKTFCKSSAQVRRRVFARRSASESCAAAQSAGVALGVVALRGPGTIKSR